MLVHSSSAGVLDQRWHWCNGLTPRHINLVNGHGQEWKRCSGPISSSFLGHTLNSALFWGQEGGCLKSTEWDVWKALSGDSWDFTAEPLWCYWKSCTLLLLFHYKILFPNVNKLASTLGWRGLIKRKVKGEHSLVNCFQNKPSMH